MTGLLIEPVVEYLSISPTPSKQGAKWEIFTAKSASGADSHYLDAIKAELKKCYGVYVFYDSMGRAIYVGRAAKTTLWAEANNAFNRDRKDHQSIWGVNHPTKNVKRVISNRQIVRSEVLLHEIADYFSAYRVAAEHINTLEAFLIRAFANNLLNKKIEKFKLTGGVGTVPAEDE
jgi:hypothetical protein